MFEGSFLHSCVFSLSGAAGNSALTPESEVAEMLRILGDRVQEEFGEELQRAAAELLPREPANLTYGAVRDAALRLLSHTTPSWTQVIITECNCSFSLFIYFFFC
jgi:hypothetical protein